MRSVLFPCLLVALWVCTLAEKPCNTECTFDYEPLCIELNGEEKTIGNRCSYEALVCTTKEAWVVKHENECEETVRREKPCNTECTFDYEPLCIELNGEEKTIGNRCSYEALVCTTKEAWVVKHEYACEEAVRRETRCNTECTLDYEPLCIELNGEEKTIGNRCTYEAMLCTTKEAWVVKHENACE